jgi:hypothetical protein
MRKGFLLYIDAHWHRGQCLCRRHQHSGILYLNPYRSILVPDWVPLIRYRTGSGISIIVQSCTGLTGCRTVLLDAGQSYIAAYIKGLHPARLFCWLWKGTHPARPYWCWCKETPPSLLLAFQMDTSCTSTLLWKGIHPASPFCWLWKWIHSVTVSQSYWPRKAIHHGCPYRWLWPNGYTMQVYRHLLMELFLLYDI